MSRFNTKKTKKKITGVMQPVGIGINNPQNMNPNPIASLTLNEYDDYDDVDGDAWEDAPKPVNIPKKVKERQPEYEEEGGY